MRSPETHLNAVDALPETVDAVVDVVQGEQEQSHRQGAEESQHGQREPEKEAQ